MQKYGNVFNMVVTYNLLFGCYVILFSKAIFRFSISLVHASQANNYVNIVAFGTCVSVLCIAM